MEMNDVHVEQIGEEKIRIGNDLIDQLNQFKNIPGILKIQKKISAEVSILRHMIDSQCLTKNQILCTNLVHFAYFVKVLKETPNVQAVGLPVKLPGHKKAAARVDIVASDGREWIKVIARNPKALNEIAFGCSNYGSKSILDHAQQYIDIARNNPQFFQVPTIIFDFANQIDEQLHQSLNEMQIIVRIDGESINTTPGQNEMKSYLKINLDVTAMMAFCSSLTCDSCNWRFKEPILTDQAKREQINSTKELLDKLFEGKELIACEAAVKSFRDILHIVGGPNEKVRGNEFINKITVLPDLNENEENTLWFGRKLKLGKKIQERTHKILTFGVYHKAVTATANKGAVEAAKMQGFSVPAIVHEARALTEQKQLTAEKII